MLEVIVLAIVQGLTEFLPVSSDGHLVLAGAMLGALTEEFLSLMIFLHAGSLMVLLAYYHKDLLELAAAGLKPQQESKNARQLLGMLILGTVITGALGMAFKDTVKQMETPFYAALGLLFTGIELLSLRFLPSKPTSPSIPWTTTVVVALLQTLAILPGVSRSGSTIVAGLWLGLEPALAVRFSFLLGIPAIGGAFLLELRHISALPFSGLTLALGLTACLLTSWAALRLVIRFVEKGKIHQFGYYCLLVGLGSLLFLWMKG